MIKKIMLLALLLFCIIISNPVEAVTTFVESEYDTAFPEGGFNEWDTPKLGDGNITLFFENNNASLFICVDNQNDTRDDSLDYCKIYIDLDRNMFWNDSTDFIINVSGNASSSKLSWGTGTGMIPPMTVNISMYDNLNPFGMTGFNYSMTQEKNKFYEFSIPLRMITENSVAIRIEIYDENTSSQWFILPDAEDSLVVQYGELEEDEEEPEEQAGVPPTLWIATMILLIPAVLFLLFKEYKLATVAIVFLAFLWIYTLWGYS